MPWFLFKARVIFLIFQNICNKNQKFYFKKRKHTVRSSCLGKIWENNIVKLAILKTVILQMLTSNIDKLYHCTILYQQKGINIIM